MFKVLGTLLLILIVTLLSSMALAIYLPFNDVNRMFVAGLSVPLMFPLLIVFMLSVNKPKIAAYGYMASVPVLAGLVFTQLLPLG